MGIARNMLMVALQKRLTETIRHQLQRTLFKIDQRDGNHIVVDGKRLINFCSNDYLGLATHPDIKKAFIQGIEKYGVGSGSSVAISGYYESQRRLEDTFAEFLQRDAAIFFNSGYHANLGVISTLCGRHDVIVSDKLCHASLLDGIQLSRAKHFRYQHNNMRNASELMCENALVISESVFSMEGDISPIDTLAALSKRAKATLCIDDAHGIGVLGREGRGISEYYSLTQEDIPCLVTPFGKAIGGVGAIVSGNETLIQGLRQFSRTYHYTTALPPAVSCAAITAVKVIQQDLYRRERLQHLIQFFIQHAKQSSLQLLSDDLTPIKAICVGDNATALHIQKTLLHYGYFISCIRPPTVPKDTARIRVSLNCLHEEADIIRLLDIIASEYEKCQ